MYLESISERCTELGIVLGVPTMEGGFFEQELPLTMERLMGGIALISGLGEKDARQVDLGSNILRNLVRYDPPKKGLYEFYPGVKVSVVHGSEVGTAMRDDAIIHRVEHGLLKVREYSPFGANLRP